jgi:hypothetical protein
MHATINGHIQRWHAVNENMIPLCHTHRHAETEGGNLRLIHHSPSDLLNSCRLSAANLHVLCTHIPFGNEGADVLGHYRILKTQNTCDHMCRLGKPNVTHFACRDQVPKLRLGQTRSYLPLEGLSSSGCINRAFDVDTIDCLAGAHKRDRKLVHHETWVHSCTKYAHATLSGEVV